MKSITLTCEGCHYVHTLNKTNELPSHVFNIKSNFCPLCEHKAIEYYNEWWNDEDNPNHPIIKTPIDPVNQLCMPFELDIINSEVSIISNK